MTIPKYHSHSVGVTITVPVMGHSMKNNTEYKIFKFC